MEQYSHNVAALDVWAGLFTPESREQLELDMIIRQKIGRRQHLRKDRAQVLTSGDLRCGAHAGVQLLPRTWAG